MALRDIVGIGSGSSSGGNSPKPTDPESPKPEPTKPKDDDLSAISLLDKPKGTLITTPSGGKRRVEDISEITPAEKNILEVEKDKLLMDEYEKTGIFKGSLQDWERLTGSRVSVSTLRASGIPESQIKKIEINKKSTPKEVIRTLREKAKTLDKKETIKVESRLGGRTNVITTPQGRTTIVAAGKGAYAVYKQTPRQLKQISENLKTYKILEKIKNLTGIKIKGVKTEQYAPIFDPNKKVEPDKLQKTYQDLLALKAKTKNIEDKKKIDNALRIVILQSSAKIMKDSTYSEIVDYGNKLMSKANNWQIVTKMYNTLKKRNEKKALALINNPNYKKETIKRALGYIDVGISTTAQKALGYVSKNPTTIAQNTIVGLMAGELIKKGLSAAPLISATTKLGSMGFGANYVKEVIHGYKKAKDPQKYAAEKIVEMLSFSALNRKVPVKETFNFKKAIAQLSPYYKKLKVRMDYPQTTPKTLAKSMGQNKNFYHVTTAKSKDLIKKDVLKIISKKFGMSPDRIKYNEDFLFVSDKGLVQYGLKGTKGIVEFNLGKEASKLFKGDVRTYKSSSILRKIKTFTKGMKKGRVDIQSDVDKLLVSFIKKKKLGVGGQKAANAQLEKKYGRSTLDWDILTKNNKKDATEFVKLANKYFGYERFKIQKTPKSYQIFDKVIKDHVADFVKPNKPQFTTIEGIKFVKVDSLIQNKINALSQKGYQKRWNKDLKDLKNLLIGSGNNKKYKSLVKQYEEQIFKGEIDPTKAKYTLRELKSLGFSLRVAKSIIDAKNNPLKYAFLKVIAKTTKKPTKYNIFEFENIKVSNFPRRLQILIKSAADGKLSKSAQIKLRKDLGNYVKANPGKIFTSPKTVANFAKPFGLEEEWVIAPKSQFLLQKNFRSKFYNLFGVKKGQKITFDDQLNKVIQIYSVTNKKGKTTTNKQEIDKFLKLVYQKYKNPVKVLQMIFKDQKDLVTISPEGLVRRLNSVPQRMIRPKFATARRIKSLKPAPTRRPTLPKKADKRKARDPIIEVARRPVKIVRNDERKPDPRKPTDPIPREIIERIPERRIVRSREIITPRIRTPREIVVPRRTTLEFNPRRPIKVIIPKNPPKKPQKDYEFEIEIPGEKKKRKIKFKTLVEKYGFSPTLAGLGMVAIKSTGKFSGLEIRGEIIPPKKPLIDVAKSGKTKTGNIAKVKFYRRKIPQKYSGKVLRENKKILKKFGLIK